MNEKLDLTVSEFLDSSESIKLNLVLGEILKDTVVYNNNFHVSTTRAFFQMCQPKLKHKVLEILWKNVVNELKNLSHEDLYQSEFSLNLYWFSNFFTEFILLGEDDSLNSEIKKENEEGNYKYIPYQRSKFLQYIWSVLQVKEGYFNFKVKPEYSNLSFVDIGSGMGDKVFLSSFFDNFVKSYGIELNTHTYELSAYLLDRLKRYSHNFKYERDYPIIFFNEDAIEFDLNGLRDDNNFLLYSFVPIANSKKLLELYKNFIKQMKVGDFYLEVSAVGPVMESIKQLGFCLEYSEFLPPNLFVKTENNFCTRG